MDAMNWILFSQQIEAKMAEIDAEFAEFDGNPQIIHTVEGVISTLQDTLDAIDAMAEALKEEDELFALHTVELRARRPR